MRRKVDLLWVLGFILAVGMWGCAKRQVVKPVEIPQEVEEIGEEQAELIPEEESARDKTFAETSELEDVHFDFDKYNIRPDAKEILNKNALWLKEHGEVYIQVEGHCDERGTVEYNLALGQRRATSVRSYLIRLGISPKRISTISYGEEKPLDPGYNEEAWAKNRRAHFLIR